MEKELWEACSQGNFTAFQNLLKDATLDVNSTNKDGQRLFNTICDAVSRGNLAPDFYFEILKRKELDINFQDEKNVAPIVTLCTTQKENGHMNSKDNKFEFGTEEYYQEKNNWEEKTKTLWTIKNDMLKALLEREDFDTKAVYTINEKMDFCEYQSPIGIVLDNCATKGMLECLVESEKFDLNSVSYQTGHYIEGINGRKKLYNHSIGLKNNTTILEHACENENIVAAEYFMDHGAKATKSAIEILYDLTREDERLYYKSKHLNDRMKNDINLQK